MLFEYWWFPVNSEYVFAKLFHISFSEKAVGPFLAYYFAIWQVSAVNLLVATQH